MHSILPTVVSNNALLEKITRRLAGRALEKKYYRDYFCRDNDFSAASPNGKKILLYSGISSMYLTPIEILLYHCLRREGFEVDYLVYDESIRFNEVTTKERLDQQGDAFWKKSVDHGHSLLNAAGVRFETISMDKRAVNLVAALPDNIEEIFSFHYDGFDFGNIIRGVMFRYYKSISMGQDAAAVAKNFMQTALTNYFTIKDRQLEDYHAILFSHGIYCTWQIIVEYCEHNGIDFVCYDRGKTKATINVNRNHPSPVWDISEAWNRLLSYELNDEENHKVDTYLKERESQKGDVYAYNFSEKESNIDALKQRLQIKPGSKVITIFTNLIWDAANVSRDIAFSSPLDCIKSTIEHYSASEDVHILVRCHPAEKVLGTKERYGELVREAFSDNLPGNVTVIEPEMDINSFSILDISTIGVVHTSTVGLEMALEGKPVILISDTHYRDKGFTYDALNRNHYFEVIDTLLQNLNTKPGQIELARKYFYLMMFEYQHSMPMQFTGSSNFNGYTSVNIRETTNSLGGSMLDIVTAIKSGSRDFVFK